MSKEKVVVDYLNNVLENISDIREFTSGMTKELFSADKKTLKAVVRSLEIIGEAVNNLPGDFRHRYPEIAWKEIVAMRNRLIHEYFGVDVDIVWQTIAEDLEPLEIAVKKIIDHVK